MHDRIPFQKMINDHPRDRGPQLVYADWLEEHGDPQAAYWRGQIYDLGLVGRGGLVGLSGLGGLVGRGGLVGLSGLGGLVGRGGLSGLGGLVGLLKPENQIVLIVGENSLVFIPHGYGFSVFVGHVASEHAHGWIIDPCCEVLDTGCGDKWVEFAAGKSKSIRTSAKYGEPILEGARVPFGCMSMKWHGYLPIHLQTAKNA